ncbi:MAG: FkbM family methyltransferase [Lachnospiraceae bacterium]|nr:FkbM family methyltransferase [Lachnospiraceae bacterium]
MRVVVFGLGKFEIIVESYINLEKVEIIAFADNNKEFFGGKKRIIKNGTVVPIIQPDEIKSLNEIDVILVASKFFEEICVQLNALGINKELIVDAAKVSENSESRIKMLFDKNFYCQNSEYMIDGMKIDLGNTACLPKYQRMAVMYDKFVKFLGKIADAVSREMEQSYIFDVGANVGDTVFGMIKNTNSNIIAIEPARTYYELLRSNVESLDEVFRKKVIMVNAFVSNNEDEHFCVDIQKGTGNKRIISEEESFGEAPVKTIQTVIKELGIKEEQVTLIKVDTDGYDYDVITSCKEMLKRQSPILYWENQIDNKEQLEKYNRMYEYLLACEYDIFYVFDNFGNYMGKMNQRNIKDLNEYMMRMNVGYAPRTLYYVDILACKAKHEKTCYDIIEEYRKEYNTDLYLSMD